MTEYPMSLAWDSVQVYTNVSGALYRYRNLDKAIVEAIALKYEGSISAAGCLKNAIGAYDG